MIVVDVGTSVSRLLHATRGASASLVGAAVVSTVLTAAVALPMGVNVVAAANDPAGLHEAIAANDSRFPAAVPLAKEQLEVLERPENSTKVLAAPPAVTADPTSTSTPTARATSQPAPDNGTEELAIFPTPTTEPPPTPTPRPIPPASPVPPRPTPLAPTPTATAEPDIPTAEPTTEPATDPTAPPSPTDVPEALPGPPLLDEDQPSTDLYAYVVDSLLTQNEVGTVDVKAINGGSELTTSVTMTMAMSGGTILSVTPQRSNWTCSGSGSTWSCSGPDLEAAGYSRGMMSVLPSDDDATVSVAVTHDLLDDVPGNNSLSAQVPVIPNDSGPTDPGEATGADGTAGDDPGASEQSVESTAASAVTREIKATASAEHRANEATSASRARDD